MTLSALVSPPQLLGYLALVLGVLAFLQRSDKRLKLLIACNSVAYVLHFLLLGNGPASGSAAVSCVRTLTSIRYRSAGLMAAFLCGNLSVGLLLAQDALGWLPVAGSCLATVAVFRLRGVVMRLVLLACTALWLANNLVSGSVGGTLLEAGIALANGVTTARMIRHRRLARRLRAERGRACAAAADPEPPALSAAER